MFGIPQFQSKFLHQSDSILLFASKKTVTWISNKIFSVCRFPKQKMFFVIFLDFVMQISTFMHVKNNIFFCIWLHIACRPLKQIIYDFHVPDIFNKFHLTRNSLSFSSLLMHVIFIFFKAMKISFNLNVVSCS